jgi:16S rRNA processing protein RimM
MSDPYGVLIPVGYVRRAHGIDGTVLVRPLSDAPGQRYVEGAVLTTDEVPTRKLVVQLVRPHKDGLLLSFAEIRNRGEADKMRGVTFLIPIEDRRPLSDDEYWEDDLVGLEAEDMQGQTLGEVAAVVFGAAQDRLVIVDSDGLRVDVPFVEAIVSLVSVSDGKVVLDPPPGYRQRDDHAGIGVICRGPVRRD